jgi:hypothetical protein
MTEREPVPSTGSSAYPPSQGGDAGYTAPDYSAKPVAFRGPESLGGLLLILAGIAAAISLLLDWLDGQDDSGWSLVREGFDDLGGIFDTGLWQPLAIVLGGGVLFLLGILMWLPGPAGERRGDRRPAGAADRRGLGPRDLRSGLLVRDRRRRPRPARQPQGPAHRTEVPMTPRPGAIPVLF